MSSQNTNITYEVSVDRANEKGVFVASQILLALHSLAEQPHEWYEKSLSIPWFHFEVAHIAGRIRFFLISEKEYGNLLTGQLYAHYPDIEIVEISDYISSKTLLATRAKLATYSLDNIKIYSSMKDRTEKESVDPLSSITSALSKMPKNEFAVFHVDFSPLPDKKWRTEEKITILGSSFPNWMKKILMHSFWLTKVLLLPIR